VNAPTCNKRFCVTGSFSVGVGISAIYWIRGRVHIPRVDSMCRGDGISAVENKLRQSALCQPVYGLYPHNVAGVRLR